ncbi:MAG TPA: hypothetical protein VGR32_04140 [Brevundimonas sp.]|jgi:hypothetical protein|uniref:hypothetical protein n=1 Tax=Brevundimonas sp. TaxID=1871086 RepID=UPI002DEDB82E|nr:hypothetical protein [Brevundimonas sp.]
MRTPAAAVALAAALFGAGAAAAQDPATDGQFRVPLQSIITGLAEGTCDPAHLAPDFVPLCEEQLWEVGQALQMFGAITEMRLVDHEGEGDARREIYEVDFSSGRTVKAGIGGRVDGKFTSLSFDG